MLFLNVLTAGSLFAGLLILFFTIRKPQGVKFLFLGFYMLSALGLSGQFISQLVIRNLEFGSVTVFWPVFQIAGRVAFIFFLFFLYMLNRNRVSFVLTGILSMFLLTSIVVENLFYSIIPQLADTSVILYAIILLIVLRFRKSKLKPGFRIGRLIDILFYGIAFFGIGIALDILENIPYTRPFFSLLAVDFYPVFILCIGLLFLYWMLKFSSSEDSIDMAVTGLPLESLPVTNREREVISLILEGKTNTDISEQLCISESTVKKHINSIFRKLSISSRWELLKITENSPKVPL